VDAATPPLDASALRRFDALVSDAARAVSGRFFAEHPAVYAARGERAREACREDLAFHLEFLRPVLVFGFAQPMVEYLRWLGGVLAARDVASEHLAVSLEWLAEFFLAGMETGEGKIVAAALRRVREEYLRGDDGEPAIYGLMPARAPEADPFEKALLDGDRRLAGSILDDWLDRGAGLVDAELHVIQPTLYRIGQRWQGNEVSVAQEHVATAISQSVMTQGLLRSLMPAGNGRRVALACVEGNDHAVGLQMVADAFQLSGWDVDFLGANVPTRALIPHLRRRPPDLVGLSTSFAQQLPKVREIVAGLADFEPLRPAVIVGGLAINQFSHLAGMLGVDGWAPDALSAVGVGTGLTPKRSR